MHMLFLSARIGGAEEKACNNEGEAASELELEAVCRAS